VLLQDAAALIQNLELGKPYLFGHSMGAMTALGVAADYPDLVRAAVLEDPPFLDHRQSPVERAQLQENAKTGLAFRALFLADRIARGQAENPNWSEDEILPWAESKGEYNPEIMNSWLQGESRIPPWREALLRVACPMLLITADTEKGSLVTTEAAQEAPRLCKQCEVVHISGAGHCIHRDRFAETMRVVLDFLGKH
jgi:pimeloyl-ACP methyl ester carboxylesterase